jgi:hypothetical protein
MCSGEVASATQPIPEAAADRPPATRPKISSLPQHTRPRNMREGVSGSGRHGGGVTNNGPFTPGRFARMARRSKARSSSPADLAANWGGTAADPRNGLVFLVSQTTARSEGGESARDRRCPTTRRRCKVARASMSGSAARRGRAGETAVGTADGGQRGDRRHRVARPLGITTTAGREAEHRTPGHGGRRSSPRATCCSSDPRTTIAFVRSMARSGRELCGHDARTARQRQPDHLPRADGQGRYVAIVATDTLVVCSRCRNTHRQCEVRRSEVHHAQAQDDAQCSMHSAKGVTMRPFVPVAACRDWLSMGLPDSRAVRQGVSAERFPAGRGLRSLARQLDTQSPK